MATLLPGGATHAGVWTTYINRGFVPGLKANLILSEYAEKATIPKGAGGYIGRWNLPGMYNGSTTALTDGSSGSSRALYTIASVEATVADYGEWFGVGSLAKDSAVSGTLDVHREQCAYAGATALDLLVRNAVTGGATAFLHAGDTTTAGATLATTDLLTAQDFPIIRDYFDTQNAVGWKNLSMDFMLAIHPQQEAQLVTDVTTTRLSWSEVNKHVPVGFSALVDNHRYVGRLNGVTALRTTLIDTAVEDVTAYRGIALARYGVGWLGLGNQAKARCIVKSDGGTSDPLDQLNTVGWKLRGVAAALDVKRCMIVYSAI